MTTRTPKELLAEILAELYAGAIRGGNLRRDEREIALLISLPRLPRDDLFLGWLADNSTIIEEKLGIKFHLFILLSAEAWNAPLESFKKFWDSRVLADNDLQAIQKSITYVEPAVKAFLSMGRSGMSAFKKLVLVHHVGGAKSLGDQDMPIDKAQVFSWRPSFIPEFIAAKRIYVEYLTTFHGKIRLASKQILQNVNKEGLPTGGGTATHDLLISVDRRGVTAFSDTRDNKRRRIWYTLHKDAEHRKEEVLRLLKRCFATEGFDVLVASEDLLHLPTGTRVVHSTNMLVWDDPEVRECVVEALPISKVRVLVTLAPRMTLDTFARVLMKYNEANPHQQVKNTQ